MGPRAAIRAAGKVRLADANRRRSSWGFCTGLAPLGPPHTRLGGSLAFISSVTSLPALLSALIFPVTIAF